MNDFDLGVMRKIQELRRLQGKYLTQIVVPDGYAKYMSRRTFFFQERANCLTVPGMSERASAVPQPYNRVQVDVITESEYVEESRQRTAWRSSTHLRDYLGVGQ